MQPTIYQMQDPTGEGTMTRYEVLAGIVLMYNDFHMESCYSDFRPAEEVICIDHCLEGRIEWEFENGSYLYLQERDLLINARIHASLGYGFPLKHYHGITIAINVVEAERTLASFLDGISIDLKMLYQKFGSAKNTFIMRTDDSIQHIFSELYQVSESIRQDYFKIKVIELLLFLSIVDVPENGEERTYFPKRQVNTVKAIMNYITGTLDRHFTLDELSSQFEIPLTSMKQCFKGVYGSSIYAYIRSYRIHAAAQMLRQSDASVASIAGSVGYENASKFSAAFRDVMKLSPQQYRNSSVRME